MKILWIVNKPIGGLHVHLFNKRATGGLWMEAMMDRIVNDSEMDLAVVNVDNVTAVRCLDIEGIRYYTVPGKCNEGYDYKSPKAKAYWTSIINKEKPDLLVLWGTEMPLGVPALEIAEGVPSVIFVQGLLESIGKYYIAGLTADELSQARTIRDVLTHTTIPQKQKNYLERSRLEAYMVAKAQHVIIENKWAEAYYRKISPNLQIHWCPLSLSLAFSREKWSLAQSRPHSIMCPAANYPIKGLHMLLKALVIVKKTYSDVQLSIPGTPLKQQLSLKDSLKQPGYEKLIRHMITSLGLSDNVHYTGRLTAQEMARLMAESRVFVMSSAIENHSSTLKEAMTVGVPCVSSYVGGVPEYAKHEVNCMLYRFEDYEVMAQEIIQLFESDQLCETLSENARQGMMDYQRNYDPYLITKDIYKTIVGKG
jgi:glycosyltransferase involved in cell wall biosynthesis